MKKVEQLYEGKAKKVYSTEDPGLVIVSYKDDATAFDGVKKVTIVPLEVIIRNISAGSFAKRYGVEEGIVFDAPTIEFSYKNDDLHDPLINDYHAVALKLATWDEIDTIKKYAFQVNDFLKKTLAECGVTLVDFKLEFGKTSDGTIVLADEISPDTCRFWDSKTGEKLDKDRFRRDLGNVEGAYQEGGERGSMFFSFPFLHAQLFTLNFLGGPHGRLFWRSFTPGCDPGYLLWSGLSLPPGHPAGRHDHP